MYRHKVTGLLSTILRSASFRPAGVCSLLQTPGHLSRLSSSASLSYQFILTDKRGEKGCVGVIKLNRSKALNALCDPLMSEVGSAVRDFDGDPDVGAVVITGSDRAFAAGADISEMESMTFPDVYMRKMLS